VRNLEGTLNIQGLNRTYRLHLPPVAGQAQSLPLVIALHAQGDNSSDLARASQLDAVSDKAGFLAAYPDGTGAAPGWNAGGCCGYALDHNVDDVAFVRQLIEALQGTYRADPARVFVIGYAEGGMLAQRVVVDLPGRLAGIAVVAARLPAGLPVPARPLPVVILLGTSDAQLPSEAAAASLSFWTKSDGCAPEPQRQESGALSVETYRACGTGLIVMRYVVNGGGHEWPRTTPAAAELIWSFFAAVPRQP
jgi:polyhydroxybutyrate depolymerase